VQYWADLQSVDGFVAKTTNAEREMSASVLVAQCLVSISYTSTTKGFR